MSFFSFARFSQCAAECFWAGWAWAGTASGTNVQLWECNGTKAQQWFETPRLPNTMPGSVPITIRDVRLNGGGNTLIAASRGQPLQIAVDYTITQSSSCPSCITGDLKTSPNGTKVFVPTTPNLEMQFQATVNVGINGSAIETCMAPAVRALTAPKITDPAKNGGLLRPDAVLAVVCVTDAVDQANQPVSFYLNQLLNIKGVQRPGSFTYNVVGPFLPSSPGNCVYDGNGDDGKHVQLVSQTNGVREEICTPNWATALENIGKNAFGFRTNFFLTGTPDLSNGNVITVEIDGMNLPQQDARGARVWRYDAATNSIIFATSAGLSRAPSRYCTSCRSKVLSITPSWRKLVL